MLVSLFSYQSRAREEGGREEEGREEEGTGEKVIIGGKLFTFPCFRASRCSGSFFGYKSFLQEKQEMQFFPIFFHMKASLSVKGDDIAGLPNC